MVEISFPSFTSPAAWVVGPRSHQADRLVAMCDYIAVPERTFPEWTFSASVERGVSRSRMQGRNAKLRHKVLGAPSAVDFPGVVLDMRWNAPDKWSNALCNHIPLLHLLCARLSVDPKEVTVVLPSSVGRHIADAWSIAGASAVIEDRPVAGNVFVLSGFRPDYVHSFRRDAICAAGLISQIQERIEHVRRDVPKRVFLSRRGERALENEDVITRLLKAEGYSTAYPEDHSPEAQFALFAQADEVVAIHGAGLAPLLYRRSDAPPLKVVELLPVGHTDMFFRTIAAQAGAHWAGVRGNLKARYLPDIYDASRPFLRFSKDRFFVDPEALFGALSIARAGHVPNAADLPSELAHCESAT